MVTQKQINDLTYKIIGYAIEVHKELGPGLLESVYEKCLAHLLQLNGHEVSRQQVILKNYQKNNYVPYVPMWFILEYHIGI